MSPTPLVIAVLAGASESGPLAEALVANGWRVAYAAGGNSRRAAPQPAASDRLAVHDGTFANASDLGDWLGAVGATCVIDARHPFDAAGPWMAAKACARRGLPRLRLLRRPRRPGAGDHWIEVDDAVAAASRSATPAGCALMTLGRAALAPFVSREDLRFVVRIVGEPDAHPGLPRAEVIADEGPYAIEDERSTLRRTGVTVVVARNAGGRGGWPKIAAARMLGLPVVMLRRPPSPPGDRARDVAGVLAWLETAGVGSLMRAADPQSRTRR